MPFHKAIGSTIGPNTAQLRAVGLPSPIRAAPMPHHVGAMGLPMVAAHHIGIGPAGNVIMAGGIDPSLVEPPKLPVKSKQRKKWTVEEDELLRMLVEKHGKKWSIVASHIPSRDSGCAGQKRCRERYINHLDPTLNKGAWTIAEDEKLKELFQAHGQQVSKCTSNEKKLLWLVMSPFTVEIDCVLHG